MNTTQAKIKENRTKEQRRATVETPGLAQMEMAARWDTISDLLLGTKGVRALRSKHIPQEPNEEAEDYNVRLSRTFLFEALKDTIDKVSSKPFEQPVDVSNDMLPETLQGISANVDGCGTSLNSQAKVVFKDGVTRGIMHVLVDAPDNPERRVGEGFRPQFIHIPAADIIAAKTVYDPEQGARVLSSLRYWRTKTEEVPGNEYGEIQVRYVTEWERTRWRLHLPDADGELVPQPWTVNSFRSAVGGGIPLVTKYLAADGEFMAAPPFSKLADLNVEHLQKSSDHTNLGRFAAVGVLALYGFEGTDAHGNPTTFSWGPRNTLRSEKTDAKAQILEHTGSALGTLSDGIQQVEERMEGMGLEPFQRRSGAETATGKAMHAGKSDTAIRDWVREIEALYVECYKLAAEWLSPVSTGSLSLEIPEDFRAKFFTDFSPPLLKGADDTPHLIKFREREEISHETFLAEGVRRGILSPEVSYEREIERLENEAPQMPPPSGTELGGEDG